MKKSKQGRPPAAPIDWKLPDSFSIDDVQKEFWDVLLRLKKMGRRRWPAWEEQLVKYVRWGGNGPSLGLEYAKEIVRGRWPEIEPGLIAHSAKLAEYLKWRGFAVGTGPLEGLILGSKEHDIADRAQAACLYAEIVVKDHWEEGERVILEAAGVAEDAYGAAEVARAAEAYRERFFPRRLWPALQKQIREGRCTPDFVVEYSDITGKKCNKDANEGLLKADRSADGLTELLWEYADMVLNRKLPDELHSVMLLKSFERPDDPFVKEYMETYGM